MTKRCISSFNANFTKGACMLRWLKAGWRIYNALGTIRTVLQSFEWLEDVEGGETYCPVCARTITLDHSIGCELDIVLDILGRADIGKHRPGIIPQNDYPRG